MKSLDWKEWLEGRREQSRRKRAEEVKRAAVELVTLSDYAGSVYVAFAGNPLFALSEKTTMAEAVEKLNDIRANYIVAKLNDPCTSRNG